MAPETITCLAAVVTAAAAAAGGFLARGSTAVPAAAWATAAALALAYEAGWRAAGGLADPAAQASARMLAAALAVCPAMSVLGAKRPQHGVWQLIVATLACVLTMPAVSAVLVRPGDMPDPHLLERCFLPLLVAVGWMNFVGTRHGLAATLVAAGQAGLMVPFLPGVAPGPPNARLDAIAAVLLAAGALLAAVQSAGWPAGSAARRGLAAAIDRPLLALRETLGAAWTLRIAERFNAVAEARGWPCRLRFTGLEVSAAEGGAWERDALRCCRSILRRFVSVGWLERHGGLRQVV
ncbi:MAG: hypothetical protein ACKOCX_08130 [Planctomycetota bacterium]